MDPMTTIGIIASLRTFVDFSSILILAVSDTPRNFVFLVRSYGLGGVVLWVFGSGTIWRMQKQVLESEGDKVSMDFKTSVQNESNMIAVAASVHWVARGFFTFSLISAIISVYYASAQYRILGRLLNGNEVKKWIRNDPHSRDNRNHYGEFMPSPTAVLTISAPNMLLSASLNSVLLGFGVYLAYVWTRHLDAEASSNDSRAVFITFVVSLTVCYAVYELSSLVVVRESYTSDRLEAPQAYIGPGGILLNHPPRQAEDGSKAQQSAPATRHFAEVASMSTGEEIQNELIQELRKAAQLRRDSAAADEHIAQLFERLHQQHR
ncbi:hypothetical protein N431DRAFT_503200 [Stipitochalara longipes BDJ]|nr:hypothetical protein N431DRAFT_503200 [Stipitochalara longipes BDJ]